MTAEVERDFLDERREFHEARLSGIGATDTPKILGLSARGSALTVYEEKKGLAKQEDMGLPAWLGLRMQNVVGELYTAATGIQLRADNRHHRSREHEWLVCHLDFRARGRPRLLVEAKTRAFMRGWGEDGTAEVPLDIFAQVQHEMAVTGAEECHVAVLFGHHTYRTYKIVFSPEWWAKVLPVLDRFWHDNVLAGVPPEPTSYAGDSDAIKRQYEEHDDQIRSVTPEQEVKVRQALLARMNALAAAAAFVQQENVIKQMIGENAGISGSFGTITWKRTKDGTSVDWEQVASTRGRVVEDLTDVIDIVASREALTEEELARVGRAQSVEANVVGLFTTVRPGTRRMDYGKLIQE